MSARLSRRTLLVLMAGSAGTTMIDIGPAAAAAPVTYRIEGSDATVALAAAAAPVLLYAARRFHYEVDPIRPGEVAPLFGGTGVLLRPGAYPAGATDVLFPAQVLVIRDILVGCGGLVRWGGDDRTPSAGLFRLDVRPGDPRLAAWHAAGGSTPGSSPDPLQPSRRTAARNLKNRQTR
ncbi:hypothetical protein [Actinoplanes couchii]|uniref:Uncharacterized protein n=1 Tax=Actinoplanes couchii TaxID=403638 RepID=A0ABQ3XEW3_9ACTN|nr:hypothetical protein [Actinoplanes couchii]MDR6319896.1 hypothetical protein [Actinoplanes couchii]GID57032.1 hypothetical protein Aco03nite_054360 [Actinoplanes couchii]